MRNRHAVPARRQIACPIPPAKHIAVTQAVLMMDHCSTLAKLANSTSPLAPYAPKKRLELFFGSRPGEILQRSPKSRSPDFGIWFTVRIVDGEIESCRIDLIWRAKGSECLVKTQPNSVFDVPLF